LQAVLVDAFDFVYSRHGSIHHHDIHPQHSYVSIMNSTAWSAMILIDRIAFEMPEVAKIITARPSVSEDIQNPRPKQYQQGTR
jgi:hypothetical protein